MKACASICSSGRGGCNGLLDALVLGGSGRCRVAGLAASPPETQEHTHSVQLADVLRAAHSKLDQTPAAPVPAVVCPANAPHCSHCAGICAAICLSEGFAAHAFG